jgi:hypothetical protein
MQTCQEPLNPEAPNTETQHGNSLRVPSASQPSGADGPQRRLCANPLLRTFGPPLTGSVGLQENYGPKASSFKIGR